MIGSELVLAEIIRQSTDGRVAIFTSNGTFKVPPGIDTIFVTAIAAGNSGESGTTGGTGDTTERIGGNGGNGGRGGNAGQKVINLPINITPNSSVSVTVGSGNTIFGSHLTLIKGGGQWGGAGGKGGNPISDGNSLFNIPGATGYADIWGTGADGDNNEVVSASDTVGSPGGKGGRGASGIFSNLMTYGGDGGNGGNGSYDKYATAGVSGSAAPTWDYGSGGGGGGGGGGSGRSHDGDPAGAPGGAGGAGRPGILIVRW